MEFAWDEAKRLKVLEKHGIDFRLPARVVMGDHVILPARSDAEPRSLAVGFLDGEWLAVGHMWRGQS